MHWVFIMTQTVFIFGLGYTTSLFARQALEKGWSVIATTRDPAAYDLDDGIERVYFDGTAPIADFTARFSHITHVLHSIPPHKDNGDPVYHHHHQDLMALPHLKWMSYLSTTGVYGNYNGAMVDENSPCHPTSPRAQARKIAEQNWRDTGLPVDIFRLAGIYGPDRNIFKQIITGTARAIEKAGHKFSRIHVADIVGTLWAAIATTSASRKGAEIYNVCDDLPSEPLHLLHYACDLIDHPRPTARPFSELAPTLSPMALSFWQDHKSVDNRKLKTKLGYQLQYPTFREALNALAPASTKGHHYDI